MNRSYPGRSPSIRCPVCVSTSPVAVAAACMDARSVWESWRGGGGGEDGGGSGIWSWYRRRGCESDATCEYTVARALSSSSMRFCRVSLAMVDSLRPVHQPRTECQNQLLTFRVQLALGTHAVVSRWLHAFHSQSNSPLLAVCTRELPITSAMSASARPTPHQPTSTSSAGILDNSVWAASGLPSPSSDWMVHLAVWPRRLG